MPVVEGNDPAIFMTPASARDREADLLAMLGVAFEKSTVAMLLVDGDHLVRCSNSAATESLGRTRLIGRPISELCCRDTAPLPDFSGLDRRADRPEGGQSWATMLADSGERLPLMMHWHTVTGGSGARYFLVQLWDITPAFWHFASDLPPEVTGLLFDRDLRCVRAVGKDTGSGRYDSGSLIGRLLSDFAPSPALELITGRYLAALEGHPSVFEYSSPVDAATYRVSVRPVTAEGGEILGILAILEDVTADRVRREMLEQVHQLSRLGTCSYSIAEGWVFGQDMLNLLGIAHPQEALAAMDLLVVPEDRERARADYRRILTVGGRSTVQYRLMHGKSGVLRHMAGAIDAAVDADGTLMRAIFTLADVTDAVQAETAKATAAQGRTKLMRQISDALTIPTHDTGQVMQTIAEVVTAALGDCTVLRVLAPDGLSVETEMVSPGDDITGIAARVAECLLDPVRGARSVRAGAPAVRGCDELWSSIENPDWSDDFEDKMGYPVNRRIHHFISAPIRHEGAKFGVLRVFRFERETPYQPGDDDVLQVLADRIGAVIAERRIRELLEQQQSKAKAIADRLNELTIEQRELLEQLSGVEERERTLLAMAIHDGPMQSVVAVMMRMEGYTLTGASVGAPALAAMVDILETSVQRLRTLIIALTPPDLDGGLRAALTMLAEGIFTGTDTQIGTAGPVHVALTPLRKGNAHRILREALVNVRKHAHAKHVTIELEQTNKLVVARIIDDGVGAIKFDAGPGHLGMVTMRARARAEGGRLEVDSTPGMGTTLTLSMPINIAVGLGESEETGIGPGGNQPG